MLILLLWLAFAISVGGTYQDSDPQYYTLYKIYELEETPESHYEEIYLISDKEVDDYFKDHANVAQERNELEQKLAKEDASLGFIGAVFDYFFDAVIKKPKEWLTPPSNSDDSIQYLLYTPKNKKEPCLIQPRAKQFDKCSFDRGQETKFLIHGFVTFLAPGNLFDDLKDALLQRHNYNVVVVDWTLYNGMPYESAHRHAKLVGEKVAEMMKFIETHVDASLKTLHCIGHSLGSHICGSAGRNGAKIGRITGLDPGGIDKFLNYKDNFSLKHTDADFVDAMHTSDIFSSSGLGYLDAMGHLDFYVNGGVDQPLCVTGKDYKLFNGKTLTVRTVLDQILCNHFITIEYFTNSLKDGCTFLATECESYSDFKDGKCSSRVTSEMGLSTKKIKGMTPMRKFYLQTTDTPPFCKG